MKNRYITFGILGTAAAVLMLSSCTEDPNSPGVEYMPDMYRSPAIEAYVDYENINQISARTPAQGSIPFAEESEAVFQIPYPYSNTPEDYEKAGEELTSPLPTKKAYVEQGKAIYEVFCIQCHGEKGEGNGSITQTAGGKYPVVPSYSSRKGLPEGKMFHTLTYGKGLMGSHASQLDQKERWKVIQYVKVLMSGEDPEYEEGGEEVTDDTVYDNQAADY